MVVDRITELSHEIAENTKILSDYLTQHNLSAPSFDVHGLHAFDFHPESDALAYNARLRLLDSTEELHALVLGAKESVKSLAWHDAASSLSLQAVYHYNVAGAFPLDEEISYVDLAQKLDMDFINLRRIVRHAMTNHIFYEPRKGCVAHTCASRLLVEDEDVKAWVGMFLDDGIWKASANTVEAMDRFPGSQEPNQSGVSVAFNTSDVYFAEMAKHPGRLQRFGKAMTAHSNGEGFEQRFLVENYHWEELGEGTVIDVGGARGNVAIAIAQQFPKLKLIVQELPTMVTPEVISAIPADVKDRVSFQAHNFFEEQTVQADAYIFRWIFHNWSDKYAIEILRKLVPSLKPGARVVINDGTLPEVGSVSSGEERDMRTMDLLMLTVVNAREREVDDWKTLFEQADPRYEFVKAEKPKYCRMWIIEAKWNP